MNMLTYLPTGRLVFMTSTDRQEMSIRLSLRDALQPTEMVWQHWRRVELEGCLRGSHTTGANKAVQSTTITTIHHGRYVDSPTRRTSAVIKDAVQQCAMHIARRLAGHAHCTAQFSVTVVQFVTLSTAWWRQWYPHSSASHLSWRIILDGKVKDLNYSSFAKL